MSDKSAFPIGEHVFYQRFFFSKNRLFINILTCGNLDVLIFYAYIATIIAKSKHKNKKLYKQKVNFDNAYLGHQCEL